MTAETLQCSVITPAARVYDGQVRSVVIPAHDGKIGILPNRAALLCKLGTGRMRIRTDGAEESWFIDGGFARVLDNQVIVLTQEALPPARIDRSHAQALLAEARRIKVVDEITARRKAQLEAAARARLRIAAR